jgi:uncharacterized protein DUF6335
MPQDHVDRPREPQDADRPEEQPHAPSPTSVVSESLSTGVVPLEAPPRELPVLDPDIQAGDPDVDTLSNTYVGEEGPGGSTPTPDQDQVDDIGRACGVAEEDSGALRTSSELLDRRDRRRAQQDVPEPNPLVNE